MKKMTKSALLAATLIALPIAHASADTTPGWYAGLDAGVNFQESSKAYSAAGDSKFKYGPGFDAAGQVGYAWIDGFRFEGEAFHGYSVVKHADGALSNTDLFANGFYDFNMNSMFTPYLGAGVGVGFPDAEKIGPTAGGGYLDDTRVKLAYQGIAGVSAQLDPEWAVTADYRYIGTLDPKFKDTVGAPERTENASHNFLVGVRYSFDAPTSAPRTTAAPALQSRSTARPAVAPVPQTFQVFFDFNKSDLTPEAKRIIASAAQAYKSGSFVRIVVTGHTDTKGTAKYNKKLSDRRAASVKAEFETLGVKSSVVVTQGVGKNGLLVPTNDQVREAQNRRAEIVLSKQ